MVGASVGDLKRSDQIQGLSITPLTGTFGASLGDMDLSQPMTNEAKSFIFDTLKRYKLLVIPGQANIDPVHLVEFARIFGTPEETPHVIYSDYPGVPAVKVLQSSGVSADDGRVKEKLDFGPAAPLDTWHTDGSTRGHDKFRWISVLQAIDIPPWGRDTLFADMEAAFEGLSRPVRDFLSNLSASHEEGGGHLVALGHQRTKPPMVHPVVIQDPKTGRHTLYVNRMYTRWIEDLRPDESESLLQFLFRQTQRPEYQARVVWKPGSIVVWDNARTQHYLVQDMSYKRVMHRVMALEHE